MDRIKQLYGTFSKSEAKALKNLLAVFHSKGENKPLELIRMIETKPHSTAEEASKKLYGDPKSKAFIMMKARLYDRMTEILGLITEIEVKDDTDAYFKSHIEFRKAMLTASVLRSRRLSHLALPTLEEATRLAQKTHHPEWEVDALNQIRSINRHSQDELDQLTLRIRDGLQQTERDVNASALFVRHLRQIKEKANIPPETAEQLEKNLIALEDSLLQCYSVRADFYRYRLRSALHLLKAQIGAYRDALRAVIELLEKHEGLRMNERMANPYFELAIAEFRMNNYDDGLAVLSKSLSYVVPGTISHFRILIPKLFAYIKKRDLEAANGVLHEMETLRHDPGIQGDRPTMNSFLYFKSTLLYLQGKLPEAWHTLQDSFDLSSDKEGWAVVVRIFEIMILIDRDLLDLASQKIENLRKHLSRHQTEPRLETIYKLLAGQERNGFCFKPFKNEEALMKLIEHDYPPSYEGYELILFQDWYRDQYTKRRP